MTQESTPPTTIEGLTLGELFAGYIQNRARRFESGEAVPDLGSEVVPHDAAPSQAPDARLAWDEAVAVLASASRAGKTIRNTLPECPEWKTLVMAQEPALDLAFCVGNFPQMVRDLASLLAATVDRLPASRSRPVSLPGVAEWAEQVARKPFPQPLLAAGMMRLTREYDRAEALLTEAAKSAPSEMKDAVANERAALLWHSGKRKEALAAWEKETSADYLPAVFNRGMALLFLGQPTAARPLLSRAVAELPDDSSWHHLARLYLTLAEMRQ